MSQFPVTPIPEGQPEENQQESKPTISKFTPVLIGLVMLLASAVPFVIKRLDFSGWSSPSTSTSEDPKDRVDESVVRAKIGDCINDFAAVDDAKIVDCTSAEAKNRVVGVLESVTEMTFNRDDSLCAKFPDAEQAIWYGRITGDVWCIAALKEPKPTQS